jgi:hypothetical protein
MSKRRILFLVLFILAALVVIPNTRSLYEGIWFYLRDAVTYNPYASIPVNHDGRHGSLYDLSRLRNVERLQYLHRTLDSLNLSVTPIAIPNSPLPNLFVRFDSAAQPLVIFSAHYDKLFDEAEYQGASDNTAAVSVLLAAIDELARRGDAGNRAFLFTGEEETGLRGATAFVEYARANKIAIREIINLDNLGRDKLAIRPSAPVPGFVFNIPWLGDLAFDGREIRPSPAFPLANSRLTQALLRVQPEIIVYERFTALGDSNVFQANGIDTVMISASNMYYLEQTWHTYADRWELIDERNLDRALDLILNYR